MLDLAPSGPPKVQCGRCAAEPRLVHELLDVRTGGTLRMYKCQCGEQIWTSTSPD